MRARRHLLILMGALTVVCLSAATAWACTASAYIEVGPTAGEPGDHVAVTGQYFPQDSTVRVYWQPQGGAEPRLLFETDGSSFDDQFTVPADAASGNAYYLRAYGYRDGESEPAGVATASFEIEGTLEEDEPAADAPDDAEGGEQPQGSEGSEPQGSAQTEPQGSQGAEPEDTQAGEPEDEPAGETGESEDQPASEDQGGQDAPETEESQDTPEANAEQPAEDGQGAEPTAPQPAQPEAAGDPGQQAADPQPNQAAGEPAGEPEPAAAAEPAGDAGDAADETSRASRDEVLARMPTSTPQADAPVPSAETGSGDLWSGLGADRSAATMTAQDAAAGSDATSVGQQLAMGVGLLGVGLVLLMGGATVAVRRRHRLAEVVGRRAD